MAQQSLTRHGRHSDRGEADRSPVDSEAKSSTRYSRLPLPPCILLVSSVPSYSGCTVLPSDGSRAGVDPRRRRGRIRANVVHMGTEGQNGAAITLLSMLARLGVNEHVRLAEKSLGYLIQTNQTRAPDRAASDNPAHLPCWQRSRYWHPAASPIAFGNQGLSAFFERASIVLSLTYSMIVNVMTCSSRSCNVQCIRATGCAEHARKINFASAAHRRFAGSPTIRAFVRSPAYGSSWREELACRCVRPDGEGHDAIQHGVVSTGSTFLQPIRLPSSSEAVARIRDEGIHDGDQVPHLRRGQPPELQAQPSLAAREALLVDGDGQQDDL